MGLHYLVNFVSEIAVYKTGILHVCIWTWYSLKAISDNIHCKTIITRSATHTNTHIAEYIGKLFLSLKKLPVLKRGS